MHEDLLLGRQPIVDADGSVVAFELLFRGPACAPAAGAPPIVDDLQASSEVILRAVADLGLAQSLGRFIGYVNADRALLMADVVEVLPPERFVLEILENTPVDDALRARLEALRAAGYRLALDDLVDLDDPRLELLPLVDVVKVDLLACPPEQWQGLADRLRPRVRCLLAEKVETTAQFDQARACGFTLFQGYFFSRPQLLRARRVPASLPQMLRLVALLEREPDIDQVARAVRGHPALLKPLLSAVSSSAAGFRKKIDSIQDAVALVGLRQISRWTQLLLYSEARPRRSASDPLVLQVGLRARMMELLAVRWHPGDPRLPEQAFLTGMLSKVDVLLGMPMDEVLRGLPLSEEIGAALVGEAGTLGEMLAVCEARERADAAELQRLCGGRGPDAGIVSRLESEAAAWSIGQAARLAAARPDAPPRASLRPAA